MPFPPDSYRPRRTQTCSTRPHESLTAEPALSLLCNQTATPPKYPNVFIMLLKVPVRDPSSAHLRNILHIVLLILLFVLVLPLRRQRLRPDLFHVPPLQSQHPMAAPGEGQVMRCNQGGQLVLAM